jgi:hypothetical protein
MTDHHRATPEQWELLQRQGQTLGSAESIAILELRARVEALEGFLLELTSTVSSAALDAAGAINDHADSIEALEQRLTPPMAEVAANPAPASEPPPLDVPQSLARDWINRHGTFAPGGGVSGNWKERTGTDWGMVITEAARWGQRQGWFARAAAEARQQADQKPPLGLMPRWLADEKRLADVDAALQRYKDANLELPDE